jgi:hypothetical protein
MGDREDKAEDKGEDKGEKNGRQSLNPFQVVASVFAAGLGIQSSRNRERDFKQGRAGVFIVAGIVFTLIFIGTVYAVVQLVLKSAAN